MKIANIINGNGNAVKNQYVLYGNGLVAFQSYETLLVVVKGGKTFIKEGAYGCSQTTSKYLNVFLGGDSKSNKRKMEDGTYYVVNGRELSALMREEK